ncbi:CDP-alcohol phosphatidyltransferase family protein [Vaginisenegalia massiliensis]|uniref:CDP-alcohol phosphatidyltransferase family protein n=1 Tax=Vaginisenegalia massiliensis TaxID=2058294 RepID=UPI000F51FD42|nr:CDP-alcohol phosphatidyltransferase family protein [Vaginisenegalia massiliensis]
MIGEYDKSVFLTYLGASFAVLAMALVFQGNIRLAMMVFILAGICDLFDGQVARRCQRTPAQEAFGVEIDSLCDMISFAALPACLLFSQIKPLGLGLFLAILYVLAAVSRLAYFNRNAKSEERYSYFVGLPVTYSALVFPLSYWVVSWFGPHYLFPTWLTLGLVMPLLFVLKVKLPKPNKWAYLFLLILAVVTLFGLGGLA